jgi:competence ComEA-like helix-hairpin-helix protein
MPTPSEQKALAFVAIVILLGGAVRIVRAGSSPEPTPLEQQGLARQSSSADSAAGSAKKKKGRRPVGAASARAAARDAQAPQQTRSEQLGYPPPGPRIDVSGILPPKITPHGISTRVDLDHASAAEMEALPRVGPALAKRLVANRDSLGPFGTIEGLKRVKGVGPATIRLLEPLVTFGGRSGR